MPEGTPYFVGNRLREAREIREMTAGALAKEVYVTPAAISAYEKGKNTPSAIVFEKIIAVLDFKESFFFRPEDQFMPAVVFDRSLAATTKAARKRSRYRVDWLQDIVKYLTDFVSLPCPNVPTLGKNDWLRLTESDIEQQAQDARRSWRLGDGPISNMTTLVENNGIIVSLLPLNAKGLDASSVWSVATGRPYIMLGDDRQSAFRTRYNVAHELGHLILHRTVTAEAQQKHHKLIERQADRFAAAFLTPANTFSMEVGIPQLDLFRVLKRRWRVSIKMMVHRAQELDIMDRVEARRLYINYNRRSWHLGEPLDDMEPIEAPNIARTAFEVMVESGGIPRSRIATDLPFNNEDVELLANLPPGYLDEDSAYVMGINLLRGGAAG